jgi:hypothetical protein
VAAAGFGIKKNKDLLFPVLFYFLNLVLMLQLVSIGRAIVSERYTYLAYLGLFLGFATLLNSTPKFSKIKNGFYILSAVFGVLFISISVKQIKVWQNSETFWTKAITENPED